MTATHARRKRRKALAGAPLLPWWAKPAQEPVSIAGGLVELPVNFTREAEIRELFERGEVAAAQAIILDELEARERRRP